jgi:hypothetical protein
MDKHLLSGSQEKRSVALRLAVELVSRVPADLIPIALSRSAVKCLFACRVNRKHTLYALAGNVIKDLVAAVGESASELAHAKQRLFWNSTHQK